ncbi:CdaR family transcriptional regulator [Kineosporia sp. R_H_3]|uniref:PucR family transcriptional regulator n=1 Tax=Kineosporia sp. R_H_3 TaxID=1961848 RepID=UPI000B4BEC90|nr:PucR family transcriptional regulator [Kineosporia sp. R_H_3]
MDGGLALDPAIGESMRERLQDVAGRTVDAVRAGVPEYSDRLGDGALSTGLRETLESSVRLALGGFLTMAEQSESPDAGMPLRPVLDAAYALGRGEARSGRTMAALLAAYRVGARVAWREWSAHCVELGMSPATLARFAELVFAYIDALSAASVTGHSDELAVTGRVREQYRERLAKAILDGEPEHQLLPLAQRAEWDPPQTLVAVVLSPAQARFALAQLPSGTLHLPADVVGDLLGHGTDDPDDDRGADDPDAALDVLLVPAGAPGRAGRRVALDALRDRPVVVGPARPWVSAAASLTRAVRLLALHGRHRGLLDTETHLTELVLGADREALADLRATTLAPLDDLRPDARQRLVETLRSWLLHQGRRDDVAAQLVVHPQTVRYRMTQLRRLFGDTLTDPEGVLALTVAVGLSAGPPTPIVPARRAPSGAG